MARDFAAAPLAFVMMARRMLRTPRPLTTHRSLAVAVVTIVLPILVPLGVRPYFEGVV
jgi:hypothetical protein